LARNLERETFSGKNIPILADSKHNQVPIMPLEAETLAGWMHLSTGRKAHTPTHTA